MAFKVGEAFSSHGHVLPQQPNRLRALYSASLLSMKVFNEIIRLL